MQRGKLAVTCKHCNGDHWNNPTHLPTPGCKLEVKLEDGQVFESIRPKYVSSYVVDPEFKTIEGEPLRVVAWRYK